MIKISYNYDRSELGKQSKRQQPATLTQGNSHPKEFFNPKDFLYVPPKRNFLTGKKHFRDWL